MNIKEDNKLSNQDMKETGYSKVLLIGIDGFDPKIMNKLMGEGKLPNFYRLKSSGTFTTLETSTPPQSPVAWTSIATGTNPGKHNIFDFIRVNHKNYIPELSLYKEKAGLTSTKYESYIKGKQFWDITTEAGIHSTVIRWPLTFPPGELEGNLLSGLGVPDIKGRLNSYSFYTSADDYKNEEGAEKVIEVDVESDTISTVIKGPRTKKGGKISDITVPMQIKLSDDGESAILHIQKKKYKVNLENWSDWVRIKFKVNLFTKVNGICRFYLSSVKPFKMYMTTVQIDPKNPVQPISYPGDYSEKLAEEIGTFYTLGLAEDTNALNEKKITDDVFLEQVEQVDREREKMFWYEFNKFKKRDEGVFAFVFDGSDRVQHMFWDEKVLGEDDDVLTVNSTVEQHYIEKDRFLGEVLDRIDNETAVFVFSDHGFTGFERAVSINSWLVENGYMSLTRAPTEDEVGELFEYVDWSKTVAYSVGFTNIFINQKGREGKGVVDPAEKEPLVDEIASKLENLTDEELGRKAVANVYQAPEVYSGDYVDEAPDIVVGFAPGYRMSWQNAVGGVTPEVFFNNTKHWRGDHLNDPSTVPGVLFTNLEINQADPHQMDIAPTVLKLLGLDIPENMDGESLI